MQWRWQKTGWMRAASVGACVVLMALFSACHGDQAIDARSSEAAGEEPDETQQPTDDTPVDGSGEGITPAEPTVEPDPVYGFADLHNHQFSEYAYQGAWYHGTTLGPEWGDEEWTGMSACSGNPRGGIQDHAMTTYDMLCTAAGFATDDMCVHPDRTYGYAEEGAEDASYSGWPHSTSWAHQQTWWGHLQDAWMDGMTLTVVSTVNFRILCEVMEPSNYKYFYDCEDLGAVDLELDAAKEFVEIHHDWIEIATSPEDARRIINEGKLAMVLAIEVTDIFATGEMDYSAMEFDETGKMVSRGGVLTQLQYYYAQGVRSVQLGHEMDSRFAGVAVYNPVFPMLAAIDDYQKAHPDALTNVELPGTAENNYSFELDENGFNTKGLSEEGAQLLQAMMDLGMLIDIAHLSRKSVEDLTAITEANAFYPIFHSHAKFADIMDLPNEEPLEKYTTNEIAAQIKASGGIIGMRTFDARVNDYVGSVVTNNCDGSTRSFAQAYEFADLELQVPVAFAVDFNGFADQTGPRFGMNACDKAPDAVTQGDQAELQTDFGTGTAMDLIGLGHMGLLGRGLLDDMRNLGVETSTLERSSENFIRTWERSLDPNRSGPLE